jgi:DNA (cytosine-5)-methyltransferase 1
VGRGLAVVLGDLAALGYDARWTVLGAHDVGAPHKRDRLWILAESNSEGREPDNGRRAVPDEERHGASALREPQQPAGAGGTGSVADAERVRQSPSSDGAFGCQASRNGEPPELARGGGQVPDADRLGELQPGGGIDEQRRRVGDLGSPVPIASSPRLAQREGAQAERAHNATARGGRWPVEPGLGGAAHGLAGWLDRPDPWRDGWEDSTPRTTLGTPKRADRLRAIGNGQVPQTAAAAWQLLMGWSIEGEIQ